MERLSEATRRWIREALYEDVGEGDWTTLWCVPASVRAEAEIVSRGTGVVAGLAAAAQVYAHLGDAELLAVAREGDRVDPGGLVARVGGGARSILTGERLALNFLMRLSGVASLTRRFVEAVAGTGARITDTRKTTPLWRELERMATRAGGAVNHRSGLYDMVLIKDNHLACAGGIVSAVERVRRANDRALAVEVEVTDLRGVESALEAGVDRILLDNMAPADVARAVQRIRSGANRKVQIEASGGVTLDTVGELAQAGVDFISVGALTHSAPALDMSLNLHAVRS